MAFASVRYLLRESTSSEVIAVDGSFPGLGADEIAFFRENGYLTIPRITTEKELAWMGRLYDRIFEERLGERDDKFFDLAGPRGHTNRETLPQVLGPERHYPELLDTLFFANATTVASLLLGVAEADIHGGGHMILKPAGYGAPTPWHQDEAYWAPDTIPSSVSVWLPLGPATVESGCLHFIPGSHLGEVRAHRHIGNNPRVHGLVTDGIDVRPAVACPVPLGGATVHHARTLHFAGPNTTDTDRRAYILVMNGPAIPATSPDARPWLEEERAALTNP